ncbi:MAG TPA: hypothetical protein VEF03_10465 [Candidatus Binataceae bacterium]|nr:hypothetical protein [Candidatus Binataceae bacterium]
MSISMKEAVMGNLRRRFRVRAALVAAILVCICAPTSLRAQGLSDLYPDFTKIQKPGELDIVGYGQAYASDKYGELGQGFQLEQSTNRYVGIFGRLTGYQLWIGGGFDSPLSPGSGHSSRLNFGRGQGGLDFNLYPGTHLLVSGGQDFGDSHAAIIEGDFSSWLLAHSFHPVNFSFSSTHNFENRVTSNEIDIQAVVLSTEKYMVMLGGGGAMYFGGFLGGAAEGQGGPDVSLWYRPWNIGISAQAGYGDAHQYGQINLYKALTFLE